MKDEHMLYLKEKVDLEKSVRGTSAVSELLGPLIACLLWRRDSGTVIEDNGYLLLLSIQIFSFLSLLAKEEGSAKCR